MGNRALTRIKTTTVQGPSNAIPSLEFKWSDVRHKTPGFFGQKFSVDSETEFENQIRGLTANNDNEKLNYLARQICLCLNQAQKSLYTWVTDSIRFKDIYAWEWKRLCTLQQTKMTAILCPNRIGKHCRGVLLAHLYIMQNLENPKKVDAFLRCIASSHVFLSKTSLSIKKHDEVFFKFLKQLFDLGQNKVILLAVYKYLRLVSSRLQVLINEKLDEKNVIEMAEELENLKPIYSAENLLIHETFNIPNNYLSQISASETTVKKSESTE